MISRDDKRREMAHYHEQCLIGSVLLYPPSLDEIADVEPGHFANYRHEAIFSTVREMYESSNRLVDHWHRDETRTAYERAITVTN